MNIEREPLRKMSVAEKYPKNKVLEEFFKPALNLFLEELAVHDVRRPSKGVPLLPEEERKLSYEMKEQFNAKLKMLKENQRLFERIKGIIDQSRDMLTTIAHPEEKKKAIRYLADQFTRAAREYAEEY